MNSVGVHMARLRLPLAVLCLAVFFVSIHAQVNTSTIAGVVSDQTGSVVSNAKVQAATLATGQVREATTNSAGEYVFRSCLPARIE